MKSAKSFKELKKQLTNDEHVYCKDVKMNLEQVQDMIDTMKANPNLKTLVLWNNGIGDSGAILFADFIKGNTTVTDLGLGKNNIKEEGGIALAEAIMQNNTISLLGLTRNRIGVVGAKKFGEALRVNRALQFLKLGSNLITDEGLIGLAAAFVPGFTTKPNKSIVFMELDMNMITDKGAKGLAKALITGNNETLQRLCLYDNDIQDPGAKALNALPGVKVGLFGNPAATHPDPGQATLARMK